MQPVFRLVEHHRLRPVDHFVGDLFAEVIDGDQEPLARQPVHALERVLGALAGDEPVDSLSAAGHFPLECRRP